MGKGYFSLTKPYDVKRETTVQTDNVFLTPFLSKAVAGAKRVVILRSGRTANREAYSLHITPDTIEAYVSGEGVTVETWRSGSPELLDGLYDESFLTEKDKYSAFLGGNTPLSIVRTGNEGGRLLIVRDSFADSFVPFLTEAYSEIHLFDARYYKLPLTQYIAENEIDEVLFLYSLPDLCTDPNLAVVCK